MTNVTANLKLSSDFPNLVPCDSAESAFAGYVQFAEHHFRVRIMSDCSQFDGSDDLLILLKPHITTVEEKLKTCLNAHEFLVELRDLVERILSSNLGNARIDKLPFLDDLPPPSYYEKLLSQITSLGWDCLLGLDERMRSLDICVHDEAKREHTLHLILPPNYPETAPTCLASLPEEFQLDWTGERTLMAIRKQFATTVAVYVNIFRALDDFDAHVRVLEPEFPTRRDTFRRVAVDRHASVRVQLDPRDPFRTYPQCHFLGSDKAVAPLRRRLNERMHLWDISGDVLPRENLERIMDITFAPPENSKVNRGKEYSNEDEFATECGICYTFRLGDRVPDVTCDRPECAKPYHRACLVEWLRALPETRESFGTLAGKCVYCEEAITVAVSDN